MTLLNLEPGSRIQVRWELRDCNGKRTVWWDAELTEISCTKRRGDSEHTGTITYDRAHGFEKTSSLVQFVHEGILIHLQPKQSRIYHAWRMCASSGSAVEEGRKEDTEEREHLEPARAHKRAKSMGFITSMEFENLRARVDKIEEAAFTKKKSFVGHANEVAKRSLTCARAKVGQALDKPIAQPGTLHEQGQKPLKQEFLKVHLDCSFLEFKSIAQILQTTFGGTVWFEPDYLATQSMRANNSQLVVRFMSYEQLCTVLGVECKLEVIQSLRKNVFDRKTKLPVAMRVLGTLVRSNSVECSEMRLAIGHSTSFTSSYLAAIPVLQRKTQEIDPVERTFQDHLVANHLQAEELTTGFGHEEESSGSEHSEHVKDTGSAATDCYFQMTWTSMYKAGVHNTFQDQRIDILHGTLELSIPHVTFRGQISCEELQRSATDTFISSAVQQTNMQ